MRHLDWDGCFNARDLGGLRTRSGARTRWRRIVRSDSIDGLTDAGWAALAAYGIRTVIDLRNDDERPRASARLRTITTVHLPLDGAENEEFWADWHGGPQFATPLYYAAHLRRMPERTAAVISAIANAAPGGVLIHCVGGRDRTGQIAMVLLALADVRVDEIAADHALSHERLARLYSERGEADQGPIIEAFLRDSGTSTEQTIEAALSELDVEALLLGAGVTAGELEAVRDRLLA